MDNSRRSVARPVTDILEPGDPLAERPAPSVDGLPRQRREQRFVPIAVAMAANFAGVALLAVVGGPWMRPTALLPLGWSSYARQFVPAVTAPFL